MVFAREYLKKQSFLLADNADDSGFIILPIPTKQFMLDEFKNKFCFYAGGICSNGYNYFSYEPYVLGNAFLTAEGAIAYLEENTDSTLLNLNFLIIGYGRIGKALHRLLSVYSPKITVCSRSSESETEARFNGAAHISFGGLAMAGDYDIVINTVPHIILTKTELEALKPDCLILDLASFPGGVDTLVANSLGLTVLNGRAMPSRYTVKTAGELIGKAIINIIEEELI